MTAQIKRAECPFGLTCAHVSYQARFIGGKGKRCYHPGKYLNKQLSIWWTVLCMWLAWNLPGSPNAKQGNALFKPYWGGWAGSVPAERQISWVRGINYPARITQSSGTASLAQYAPVQQQYLQLNPPSPNWYRQAPCSCPFLLDQAPLRLSRDWVADLVVKARRPHCYWPAHTVTYFSFPSDCLFSLSVLVNIICVLMLSRNHSSFTSQQIPPGRGNT